jgi:type I restriction enzyme, S subunit
VTAGWERRSLQDICVVDWGNTDLTKNSYIESGEYLAVSAAGCDGRIGHKEHAAFTPVLSAIGARCGRMFLPEEDFTAIKNTITLTPLPDRVDKKFLYYLLTSVKLPQRGAGQPFIAKGDIQKFEVRIPILSEQQRVVAILDEALTGLATANTNAEKNLKSARELFESYLSSVFDQSKLLNLPSTVMGAEATVSWTASPSSQNASSVRTGGRAATTRHIEGKRSLCVGMPKSAARNGWTWRALDGLARMESGHTPSRRHPEYWGGDVPWIGIRDAKTAHGREIFETTENTNAVGLENSSARLLQAQTVCLSRTASVGYVTIMGRPMATSQDFVNWVCSTELFPRFLMYLFLGQGSEIFKFSSGAVHQTIYFPEAKAFHVCLPRMKEQHRIVEALDALREQTEKLEAHYRRKIDDLTEAKQAILQKAFSGKLTSPPSQVIQAAAE